LVPVKQVVVGQFFRHVDAFLAPSERNVEYLLKYRADPARIRRMPFAIDVARFTPDPKDASPRRYDFLWAGKFIDFKRGQDFLAALDRVARQSDVPVHACMAGDGPHRETLLALAKQLPDSCHVDFPGFVNQGAMPATLRSAHTFVFTSERDAYGLACTEAAASGLALVVADNNGCVGPTVLAQPGVNALTYKSGDVDALATAMESLLRDAALRQRMQRASLDIAKYHDAARAAKIIEQLVTGNP
jgi:glycosyltransferase involved in cell wall biosynthesis